MKFLLELLRDPSLKGVDIDGEGRLACHGKVLAQKTLLRGVFKEIHLFFHRLDQRFADSRGLSLELGAGVSPMRDSFPEVLATDVLPGPTIDRVLDAERMELKDASVRFVVGQNCFHHFSHPDRFFSELVRVLAPGGCVVLLEPYYGPVARFFYMRLFPTECFDKDCPSWETVTAGPMNGANQALSYIVFVRDRAIFERKYPSLRIVHEELCGNYLRYIFSGGLNFRQLCPDSFGPLLRLVEWVLSPFNRWLALHHIVVLKKGACPLPAVERN